MTHSIRSLRALLVVALAALAALAMMSTAAFAQTPYPPDADFGVVCVPENPQPGQQVRCQIEGAQPGEALEVTAEIGGVVFYRESLTANQAGRASFGFRVPSDAQPGDVVTVRVVGAESGEVASDTVTVREDPAADRRAVDPREVSARPGTLPVTGGQVTLLAALGLGMVATGTLAIRRRGTGKA
jgi:hypothetical protein